MKARPTMHFQTAFSQAGFFPIIKNKPSFLPFNGSLNTHQGIGIDAGNENQTVQFQISNNGSPKRVKDQFLDSVI